MEKQSKSAHITMRAGGSTLTFLAVLRPNGTVTTTVTTRDADKKLSRGMTETHSDMATAKAHLTALAKKAEALGWQKRAGGAARPDAFSTLPAAPKQVKK
jgi:acyl dehydratase